MRVTPFELVQTESAVIGQDLTRLAQLNREVASGQEVTQPSDDPAASALLMADAATRAENASGEQLAQLTGQALQQEVSVLQSVQGFVTQARTLLVAAQNSTLTAQDLQALGQQMSGILQAVLGLANSTGPERPLFSGTAITTPFTQSGGVITYAGDQGTAQVSLGPSTDVTVYEPGTVLFLAQTDEATGTAQPSGALGLSGVLSVNGTAIPITSTMTLQQIAGAINAAGAGARAQVNGANALQVSSLSTAPLALADTSGTVFQSLGILTSGGAIATETQPDNLFDALEHAVTDLATDNTSDLASRLSELDTAQSTLSSQEAFLGSQQAIANNTSTALQEQDSALASSDAALAGADPATVDTTYEAAVQAYQAAVAAAQAALVLGGAGLNAPPGVA
jgi:flagellar hook-associated protein 3 FlgL